MSHEPDVHSIFAFHGLIHRYSNRGVLTEALAQHRTFIILADHSMLTIHVVFFYRISSNPGGLSFILSSSP